MGVKRLCAGVLLFAVFMAMFTGCRKPKDSPVSEETEEPPIPYHAVMYDRAVDWLTYKFLKDHIVRGVCDWDWKGEDIDTLDPSYPDEYAILISSQEEFEKAFSEFPEEIDFEKEMLVLYLFNDIHNGKGCKIKNIELDGQILKVHFLHNKADPAIQPPPTDCSAPLTRCLVAKMDRLEVETLEVKMTYEYYK